MESNFKWRGPAILCLGLLICSSTNAQYFQFSQYNFTGQRINPAMIGTTRYAALDADFRNQKTGGDFDVNSNFVSASYPILNQSTGRPWSGFGITMMDDRSSGIFKTQEASISYAVNVRLSRYQLLSFGVKGLYQSQRISLDGFYTGSQFIPDRGFSSAMYNGENSQELRSSYKTLSTGLYWQQTDRSGTITAYWGVSIFDFNKPQVSFLGNENPLSSTTVFSGGFQAYKQNALGIFPELLFTTNASTNVLNLGTKFIYEINPRPNQVADRVEILTKYVVGRSGIAGFQFHRENFSIGMSYDFPILKTNPGNLGAFEVGVELRRLVETKARKRTIVKRKQEEKRRRTGGKMVVVKKQGNVTPIKKDTIPSVSSAPSEIEIAKTDSSKVKTEAIAGKLSHESLVIEKITLHFHFEFNSVDLDDETEKFLDDLVVTLTDNENLKLKITGHTDNIGHEKFNEKLSLKRAEVVRDYLVRRGIETHRLIPEGKGMSNPLNNNATEEDRAKNRRVEMVMYYDY